MIFLVHTSPVLLPFGVVNISFYFLLIKVVCVCNSLLLITYSAYPIAKYSNINYIMNGPKLTQTTYLQRIRNTTYVAP